MLNKFITILFLIFAFNAYSITSSIYSNNTVYNIPDNTSSPVTISAISINDIPNNAIITGVSFRLRIPHPYVGDLAVAIKSPSGSGEVIWNRFGGTNDGGFDDDTASDNDIYFNFRTTNYFNNESINGTWQLRVLDVAANNVGYIQYFRLRFDYTVPNPDLQVPTFTISPSTIVSGGSLSMNASVKNFGAGASSQQTLTYLISGNSTIGTNDTTLGTDVVSALSPNQSSPESYSRTMPVSPANLYIGGCVSIDPNEVNQSNNCSSGKLLRIKANRPSVSPSTGIVGQNFTFTATLATNVPNSYSYYLNFDNLVGGWLSQTSPGGHIPINCSGTNCSATFALNESGAPRQVRLGMFKTSNDTLSGLYSDSRSFIVSQDTPPVVTINSSPSVSGNTLTANVFTSDNSDVTRASFSIFSPGASSPIIISSSVSVNSPVSTYNSDPNARSWGYNPSSASTNTAWNIDISGLPYGSYEMAFNAADNANPIQVTNSARLPFTKVNTPALIQVLTAPVLSGNIITANIRTSDDVDVIRASFVILKNGVRQNISNSVIVNNPNLSPSDYNVTANSWGYDPIGNPQDTAWDIDVSGLLDGTYKIEFFAIDADNSAVATSQYTFVKNTGAAQIQVLSAPVLSGNTITANIRTSDDVDVTRASFVILKNGVRQNISNSVIVNNPNLSPSDYNVTANSWGYDPIGNPQDTAWDIDVSGLIDGTYAIEFFAADGINQAAQTAQYSFTKTDPLPVITVNSVPTVANNTLTANVTSSDNGTVDKVSFTIFDAGSSTSRNTQNEIVVNAPPSTYNPASSANSWGYTTTGSTVISPWDVDISGLPEGNYEIEFNALDNVGQVGHSSTKYPFTRLPPNIPNFVGMPTVTATGNTTSPLEFTIDLDGPLPTNYAVYINFDNQQGGWLSDTDLGGHTLMTNTTGNTYSLMTSLNKPGLRYFRMGIFDTLGDNTPNPDPNIPNEINSENDILILRSAHNICDVDYCIRNTIKAEGIGNPALSRSGSQLFKNVDLSSSNFHLSTVDLSVPGIGPSFAFSRAYNSRADKQWTFGYEAKAAFIANTYDRQLKIGPMEDGRNLNFFKNIDLDNVSDNDQWFALDQGNFNKLIEEVDGSFTLYTQGNRIYKFANPSTTQAGRLIHIKDRLNHTLSFQYNGNNSLIGITDANSRNYTVLRDGSDRIIRITDFSGRYVAYTYDATSGHIKTVRDPRGNISEYFYIFNSVLGVSYAPDSAYRLWKMNNQLGQRQFTITYNNLAEVTQIQDGVNDSTNFAYSSRTAATQYTSITRPQVNNVNNNMVFIIDDKRSQVLEKIDSVNAGDYTSTQEFVSPTHRTHFAERALVSKNIAPSSTETVTSYSADGMGNPLTITQDDGGLLARTTIATYSTITNQKNLTPMSTLQKPGINTAIQYTSFTNSGKAQSITDARGNSSSRVYNASTDLMTSTTDAENNTSTMSYNGFGYLTSLTDARNFTTTSTYDTLGRIKTTTSPLGLITTYNYDASGNIISMIEQGSGHVYSTSYHYDAAGNMDYSIDPKGFRTDYTYDALGRKLTETYTIVGSGTYTRSYTYDALGRLDTTTNERNQTTQTHYTARSKVEASINPLNEMVSYTYDVNGNVETVTDGQGHTITKTYDTLNRLKRTTDDNGNYEEYTYNTAGFIATYRDKNGLVTQYTYDNNGNQKTLSYVGHPELGTVYSTYDKNNNLKTVTDAEGHITTYTYDAVNQLIELKDHNNRKWTYTYDANGNQLTENTPNGEKSVNTYDAFNRVKTHKEYNSSNSLIRSISYTYDANGNITSQSDGTSTLSYTYDELNRIKTATGHYGQTLTYGYDGVGNMTSLTYPGNHTVNYTYDNADRMKTVKDWLNNTTTYVTRNQAGQIKNVTLGNNTRIVKAYDAAGRMTSLINKKSNGTIISSHNMSLDNNGNITNATTTVPITAQLELGTTMTYDSTNRILSNGGDSYTHDLNGRIIQNSQNGDSIIYEFNNNDLITQISKNGATTSQYSYNINNARVSSTINGIETRYVIDENSGLPNVIAETNAAGVVQRYYIYGDEGLIEQIDAAGNAKFYHYDPTGNTLALTDSSQTITDKYAYSPYGTLSQETNNTSINPFLYSGKHGVMDDKNGLNYMRARYYKPDIKRFMSLDGLLGSIGNPQSLNRYAYVQGNPVMNIDPSGKCTGNSGKGSCLNPGSFSYIPDDCLSCSIYEILERALINKLKDTLIEKSLVLGVSYASPYIPLSPKKLGGITGKSIVRGSAVIGLLTGLAEELIDRGETLDSVANAGKNALSNISYLWKNDRKKIGVAFGESFFATTAITINAFSLNAFDLDGNKVFNIIKGVKNSISNLKPNKSVYRLTLEDFEKRKKEQKMANKNFYSHLESIRIKDTYICKETTIYVTGDF